MIGEMRCYRCGEGTGLCAHHAAAVEMANLLSELARADEYGEPNFPDKLADRARELLSRIGH